MAKSPYESLGVSKNASQDEIKKAYRKLVRQHHPDKNPGDAAAEARFKEVQTAYDLLSDPEKRKAYDTFGSTNGRPGPTNVDFGDFDFGDIGDFLGGLFNRGGRSGRGAEAARGQRGNDVEVEVRVSFEDSLRGAQVQVPVELELACRTCHGTGAAPGTAPRRCPECGGSGVVVARIAVRVVLACELPIRLLDLVLRGVLRHTKRLVESRAHSATITRAGRNTLSPNR